MGFPFISYSPIAEFVNFGKHANAAAINAVVAATNHTIKKTTPPTNAGLDSGSEWAEDVPTGPVKEPNWHLYGPAGGTPGTHYSQVFVWRPSTAFILQKLVLNVALGLNASANAGNDVNFTSVDVRIRQILANGKPKNILVQNYPTGNSALAGAGTQTLIIEDAIRYNDVIDCDYLDFKFTMNITDGTATFTSGMFPMFAYDSVNDTKWFSQSGVLLQGTEIVNVRA